MRKAALVLLGVALAVAAVGTLVHRLTSRGAPACNVLLITLDTTRADRVGCYGYSSARTPALDRLASRGVLFEQAFCSAPLTLPSHATMLTGMQPPEHGLRVNGGGQLAEDVPVLADAFRAKGYATAAFVAAFALDATFGLDRGFDVYDDDLSGAYDVDRENRFSVYRAGDLVVDAALKWLGQERDKPFFCWVHLYDPHYPYYHHEALNGTPFEGRADYDSEVAFMDIQVGRLQAFLEEHDLTHRTLVVAVGDHGEGLNDHGESEHGYLLYETTLRVPLICSLPGRLFENLRVTSMVSLVDLYPTLLEFIGDDEAPARSGRSLLPALSGEVIDPLPSYAESDLPYAYFRWCPLRSLTTDAWKYIRTARPELYDRREDPGELWNIAAKRPEIVEEMEASLRDLESQMVRGQADEVQLAPGQVQQLQGIGYFAVKASEVDTASLDLSTLKDMKDMRVVMEKFVELRRLLHEGKPAQAVEVGREMVRLDPDSAGIHCNFADALSAAGNLAEAEAHYLEALRLDPEHSQAHCNYGVLLRMRSSFDKAISHLEEALRINPGNVEAHYNLGCIFTDLGRLDDAAGHFEKALELNPASAFARTKLGIVFEKRNRPAEALEHYRAALRLDPDFSEAHYNVANHLAHQGQLDEAVRHYRLALASWPDYAEAHHNLALLLVKNGETAVALQHLREAVRLNPDYISARNALTAIFLGQGQAAEAAEQLHALNRLQPDDPVVLLRLAYVLATSGDDNVRDADQALALAQQACRLTGEKDAAALDMLGVAYSALGQFDQAGQAGARALELARNAGNDRLARTIEAHLDLYRANKPVRQAPTADTQPERPPG